MTNAFDTTDAGNIGNEELPNMAVGIYTDSLKVVKLKRFKGTNPAKGHKIYFKATFEMLKNENGHKVGDLVQMLDTIEGGAFPHFDQQAIARVKTLLGALAGISSPSEINAKVKGSDFELAVSDAQPFAGMVLSAVVTAKNPRFPAVVCSPSSGAAPIPSEVTQVKAVAPPIDHSTRAKAAGFLPHPSAPGFQYSGQVVKSDADILAGNF